MFLKTIMRSSDKKIIVYTPTKGHKFQFRCNVDFSRSFLRGTHLLHEDEHVYTCARVCKFLCVNHSFHSHIPCIAYIVRVPSSLKYVTDKDILAKLFKCIPLVTTTAMANTQTMNIEHRMFRSEFVYPLVCNSVIFLLQKKKNDKKWWSRRKKTCESNFLLLLFEFFISPEDVLRAFQYSIYWT